MSTKPFRAEDRLLEDSRILIAKEPVDFILYRHRQEIGIAGIVMPYDPFTPEDEADMEKFALDFEKSRGESVENDWMMFSKSGQTLPEADNMPYRIFETCHMLNEIFLRATAKHPRETWVSFNNRIPREKHKHPPAVNYTFLGEGPVFFNQQGKPYSIGTRHIALIGENLWHMAPQTPFPKNHPRLAAVGFTL